jgi:hypothetical protein
MAPATSRDGMRRSENIHCDVEVTELSTSKQHSLSKAEVPEEA